MTTPAIIDSHVHLYPDSETDTLAWYTSNGPLSGQHSVVQYLTAIGSQPNLRGFVFIEADRKVHLDAVGLDNLYKKVGLHVSSGTDWKVHLDGGGLTNVLKEVSWISRIANGTPRPGEGHAVENAHLCFAIVPWAPLPLGATGMSKYIHIIKTVASVPAGQRITGFRYLLQDKPPGTMLQPLFIESLRWMGHNGYAFDLGIDQRSSGLWQLDEAVAMVLKAHSGVPEQERVLIVINHMCKPDILKTQEDEKVSTTQHPQYKQWQERIQILASLPDTYMKISGAFSEMKSLPAADIQEKLDFWPRSKLLIDVLELITPWLDHVFEAFGPDKVMFGSDWPVCNIGGGGNGMAFQNWRWIMERYTASRFEVDERNRFWAENAAKVYSIKSPYALPPSYEETL
ncbi:hypothetical protein MMC13_004403 [Lambiella insularis]|nr:hypothetical protein [Lambiella insularis]